MKLSPLLRRVWKSCCWVALRSARVGFFAQGLSVAVIVNKGRKLEGRLQKEKGKWAEMTEDYRRKENGEALFFNRLVPLEIAG